MRRDITPPGSSATGAVDEALCRCAGQASIGFALRQGSSRSARWMMKSDITAAWGRATVAMRRDRLTVGAERRDGSAFTAAR